MGRTTSIATIRLGICMSHQEGEVTKDIILQLRGVMHGDLGKVRQGMLILTRNEVRAESEARTNAGNLAGEEATTDEGQVGGREDEEREEPRGQADPANRRPTGKKLGRGRR